MNAIARAYARHRGPPGQDGTRRPRREGAPVPNLGNAWHLPEIADPRGTGGMRDPIGAVVAGAELIVRSGNQFQGPGNAADQWQTGSAVLARRAADPDWTEFPMLFREELGNNKYYEARIPGA